MLHILADIFFNSRILRWRFIHVSRSKVGIDENHLVSWRVYSHGFLFVFAVNRIACAGSACAPETRRVRAPETRAPKTRRGHADHLRTDAPRDTPPHADTAHHTLTHAPVSGALSLLLLSPGCPQLPEIQNTFVVKVLRRHDLLPSYLRRYLRTCLFSNCAQSGLGARWAAGEDVSGCKTSGCGHHSDAHHCQIWSYSWKTRQMP